MINIRVDVDLSQLHSVLRAIEQDVPARPLMDRLGEMLAEQSEEHIESGDIEDPSTGRPWPAWAPSYVAAGAPFSSSHSLLRLDRDLQNSIRAGRSTHNTTAAGSNLPYARTHQLGRGPIPARPYLGATESDLDSLGLEVVDYIRGVVRRAAA